MANKIWGKNAKPQPFYVKGHKTDKVLAYVFGRRVKKKSILSNKTETSMIRYTRATESVFQSFYKSQYANSTDQI